ncbi:hypothetical protein CR513_24091, partial [Mucuna pruriens]
MKPVAFCSGALEVEESFSLVKKYGPFRSNTHSPKTQEHPPTAFALKHNRILVKWTRRNEASNLPTLSFVQSSYL